MKGKINSGDLAEVSVIEALGCRSKIAYLDAS